MLRNIAGVDVLYLFLLISWHAVFVWSVLRRSPVLGGVTIAAVGVVVAAGLWAGLPVTAALTPPTILGVAVMAPVVMNAPLRYRVLVGSFGLAGPALVAAVWVHSGLDNWRAVTVSAGIAALAGVAIRYVLGLSLPAVVRPADDRPTRVPLKKYHYFSQRAIESIYFDNGGKSRFTAVLQTIRVKIQSLGNLTPEAEAEFLMSKPSRQSQAERLEGRLNGFVAGDPASLVAEGGVGGFLRGRNDVWMTLYGTGESGQSPHGGRAAFLVLVDRTAVCMFGSKENCDGWTQDSHPSTVTGWAHSATADVLSWLNDKNVEWNHKHWSESVGSAALKMANGGAILDYHGFFGARSSSKMSLATRMKNVEWLAFVYYVEQLGSGAGSKIDTIMIARPIWIRTENMNMQTTDIYSLEEMQREAMRPECADRWLRWLKPAQSEPGWPLYLYRALCRARGIPADLR